MHARSTNALQKQSIRSWQEASSALNPRTKIVQTFYSNNCIILHIYIITYATMIDWFLDGVQMTACPSCLRTPSSHRMCIPGPPHWEAKGSKIKLHFNSLRLVSFSLSRNQENNRTSYSSPSIHCRRWSLHVVGTSLVKKKLVLITWAKELVAARNRKAFKFKLKRIMNPAAHLWKIQWINIIYTLSYHTILWLICIYYIYHMSKLTKAIPSRLSL